jgi:hypothetical protein
VSYVIVGAGGFVGLGRHDVAIPVNQLQEQDGKYVLAGATKEAIKGLAEVRVRKKVAPRRRASGRVMRSFERGSCGRELWFKRNDEWPGEEASSHSVEECPPVHH